MKELLCITCDVKDKRFEIAIPEGKGLVGGWNTTKKLRITPFGGTKAINGDRVPSLTKKK